MIRFGHALRVRKKLLQKELNQRAGNENKDEDSKACISCESYDVCLASYIECTRIMVDSEVRRMLEVLSKIREAVEAEEPNKEEAVESLKRLVDMCGESFCDIGNVVQNGLLGKE